MDLRKIKKLIELLEESALTEMEISEGKNTIRLSRAAPVTAPVTPSTAPVIASASPATVTPQDAPPTSAGTVIKSPLVGTFYNAPSPDESPFVTVGATVGEGDILCLIEAMKTFNQLEAEIAGVVTVVHKENGDPVEYGEPLFVIEAAD